MRAAPSLLLTLLFVVGCGSGTKLEDMAQAKSAQVFAPTASAGASAPMGGFKSGKAAKSEASADVAAEPQARLASNETPAMPRLVVRDAELTLRVEDVKKGERAVEEVARRMGGDVEASQGSDLAGPNPNLGITLRVPENRFDASLDALEGLGTRLGKTISTEDVTAQAVDLEARLKSLRVQEDAYRAILGAARRIADVLEVQERLTGVRTEIEQITAQRRTLGDQAARSKIVVNLTQSARPQSPAPEPDWPSQTWGEAMGSLRATGRALASLGLWAVAMLPVWLPLGLAGVFVAKRVRPRGV